ncbi:MAG: spiro-SPASM protein [Leptospiraceae bacterium]|nr:spiro-SPASM protein [Leptospiraceae bacterium]MCP5512077.1 spiro-SPASM protein [Leptospiraceae bacterium]
MNFTFPPPSLIAIYLNQSQIELFNNGSLTQDLFEHFQSSLLSIFGDIPRYSNHHLNGFCNQIESNDESTFILEVGRRLPPSEFPDPDIDEIYFAYFQGIYPLLSQELTRKLIERHKKYFSQYSFSENLPPGMVPVFISREFVSTLPENLSLGVHEYLLKNINQYDTEILFESPDLRKYRLNFTCNTLSSITQSESLLNSNIDVNHSQLETIIKENSNILRLGPSYINLELIDNCNLKCEFCPRSLNNHQNGNHSLDPEIIKTFMKRIDSTYRNEFQICLGGNGEPLLYNDLKKVLELIGSLSNLNRLIIESSLSTDITDFLNILENLDKNILNKIVIIVNLSTLNTGLYQKLYSSSDTPETILKKMESILKVFPKENLYVQILKIKEVESEIESYFNFFEEKGYKIILQKYNSRANQMIERRVNDLTPIHRDFCWHLTRDLEIHANGNVTACKQSDIVLGNVYTEEVTLLWEKNHERFLNSLNHLHERNDTPCLNCDEWYTFNG